MIFDPPLQSGLLIARYKRFLTDVRLDNGEEVACDMVIVGIGVVPAVAPLIAALEKSG